MANLMPYKMRNHLDLIKTEKALKELGVSRKTLRKYCRSGMPHYRRDGLRAHYFFKLSEIIPWVENYMARNKPSGGRAA